MPSRSPKAVATLTPARLAAILGVPEDQLPELSRYLGKPEGGLYPLAATLEAAVEMLRDQRDFISGQELADIFEVGPPEISRLCASGVFEQELGRGNREARYPRDQNIKAGVRSLKQRMGEGKTLTAVLKQEREQIALERDRMALAKEQKKVLPVEVVHKAWGNLVMMCRAKFLRMPNKMAPRLAYLKSEVEIEAALSQEVEECMSELVPKEIKYETEGQ